MSDQMTAAVATALRKPFPPESVGKLPKGGVMLDFVGHAAVTDRLLTVDPQWSWEPFALDDNGLPALDKSGNLWIRLTICGVTRIGVGDGKSAKEAIGDAIRNAAMRFGVALDLWAKENLVEFAQSTVVQRPTREPNPAPLPQSAADVDPNPPLDPITDKQVTGLNAAASDLGLTRDQKLAGVASIIGREITTTKELTKDEATKVIKSLNATLRERQQVSA